MADLSLADTLEDLSSRFIVNLPAEELSSIERICFQCEQAHWFYEDFLRPLNPSLPSLKLRKFSIYLLHTSSLTVPLIRKYITGKKGEHDLEVAFDDFLKYKARVPVCGAILLTKKWDKCLLVRGWKSTSWGFPKGKINQGEPERDCAVREVLEETGFDCGSLLPADSPDFLELALREQKIRLYIVPGVDEEFQFETQTRKEISKIQWFKLTELPTWKSSGGNAAASSGKFYLISPFVRGLKAWVQENKQKHKHRPKGKKDEQVVTEILQKGQPSASPPPPPAAMPHFPDPSSMFPTFAAESVRAAPVASGNAAPAAGGAKADQTDLLKSMLGLESTLSAPAAGPRKEGIGAQIIEAHGDPRGRQLLDLLRGTATSVAPDSPSAQHTSAAAADQQDGAIALLAALQAGAGATGPMPATAVAAPPRAPPSGSPLIAPKAQSTGQTQALLSLISPAKATPQAPAQSLQAPSSTAPQSSQPDADPAERQRAAQRQALLSQIMGSAALPQSSTPPQPQYSLPSQHNSTPAQAQAHTLPPQTHVQQQWHPPPAPPHQPQGREQALLHLLSGPPQGPPQPQQQHHHQHMPQPHPQQLQFASPPPQHYQVSPQMQPLPYPQSQQMHHPQYPSPHPPQHAPPNASQHQSHQMQSGATGLLSILQGGPAGGAQTSLAQSPPPAQPQGSDALLAMLNGKAQPAQQPAPHAYPSGQTADQHRLQALLQGVTLR